MVSAEEACTALGVTAAAVVVRVGIGESDRLFNDVFGKKYEKETRVVHERQAISMSHE